MLDLIIVLTYFAAIMLLALSGRSKEDQSAEQYFLSSRNLRWPSIALSTIATNINGYQFLGMMGSAYLYGLAQASLEINAVQGILIAAFIFVPMYLRDRIITVTQFIKARLGQKVSLVYVISNIGLFATITLGSALFWGAYAADLVFSEYLSVIHEDRMVRISILVIGLGIFSAIYTYIGGLGAVVKTDILQFGILLVGGIVITFVIVSKLGGWGELYNKTPQLMHLHLPADHQQLPWIHMFGLFLLNINYWCANQTIMQRSIAARSLREAQVGLMVGGLMKYVMAIIIVIPGIALYGILQEQGSPLTEPDLAFPFIVKEYLPIGVKGLILCALFASLMSTVDSTFNSLATLWSIDIYKEYINKEATEQQLISVGRKTILVTLFTGIAMGLVLLYIKFENPSEAFTHTLNALRYYVNCGVVVLICAAGFLIAPNRKIALIAFLSTVPLHILFIQFVPDMNYFVRAGLVIVIAFLMIYVFSYKAGWKSWKSVFVADNRTVRWVGFGLGISLIILHIIFH